MHRDDIHSSNCCAFLRRRTCSSIATTAAAAATTVRAPRISRGPALGAGTLRTASCSRLSLPRIIRSFLPHLLPRNLALSQSLLSLPLLLFLHLSLCSDIDSSFTAPCLHYSPTCQLSCMLHHALRDEGGTKRDGHLFFQVEHGGRGIDSGEKSGVGKVDVYLPLAGQACGEHLVGG